MKNLDKKIEGILDNYFINMNLMIIHDPIGIAREGIKALIKEEQLRIVPEKKETKEVSPMRKRWKNQIVRIINTVRNVF